MAKGTQRTKRKERKNITNGIAHINSTFNNTIVTITDVQGNAISWATAGEQGFKGSRKSTPYAAQLAGEVAGKKAMEQGMKVLDANIKGAGSGRESALRALQAIGLEINVIRDVTAIPHKRLPSSEEASRIILAQNEIIGAGTVKSVELWKITR